MVDLETTETTLDERRSNVSLIGKLEQVSLPVIFQRLEQYAKTGVLVVKQEGQWVELYFRNGRLMCIGPIRVNITLGDRLVQAGVITPLALQEVILTLGEAHLSETRIALTLMDLGYTSNDNLRTWAAKEAASVLAALLTWKNGEIYFEDNQYPPADRLLVALTISSLLPPPSAAASLPATQPVKQAQPMHLPSTPPIAAQVAVQPSAPIHPPASLSASPLIMETSPVAPSFVPREAPRSRPTIDLLCDVQLSPSPSLSQPQKVTAPLRPIYVDTRSIRSDMVLLPVDLSALREQNPQLPLTPDQWRLLTRADGRTTLQDACFELAMPADVVRQVAGELCVLGLVQVIVPSQTLEVVSELSPISRQLLNSGLGNGYVQPGYAAIAPQPWAATTPVIHEVPRSPQATNSFETRSQWGNGGNGARFVPGHGWVAVSQPLQPLSQSGPLYANHVNQGMYVQAGDRR
jgi:hypothetical protein